MTTRIIIERHGQSIGNAERIYLGITDLGLTDEGVEQAKITAEALKDEKIDVIYSSDLKRAYFTAKAHADMRGMEVKTSEKLREMFVGDWEGLDVGYLETNFYEDFVIKRTHRDFVYPGGESVVEASERFKAEIFRIAKENEGKSILVVSHSAVIRAFWYYLSGYTEQNMTDRVPFMLNAAYCILEYDGERLIPVSYNINSHLPKSKVKPI